MKRYAKWTVIWNVQIPRDRPLVQNPSERAVMNGSKSNPKLFYIKTWIHLTLQNPKFKIIFQSNYNLNQFNSRGHLNQSIVEFNDQSIVEFEKSTDENIRVHAHFKTCLHVTFSINGFDVNISQNSNFTIQFNGHSKHYEIQF